MLAKRPKYETKKSAGACGKVLPVEDFTWARKRLATGKWWYFAMPKCKPCQALHRRHLYDTDTEFRGRMIRASVAWKRKRRKRLGQP